MRSANMLCGNIKPPIIAQRKYRVPLTGTINGINNVFTVSDLVVPGSEELFKNGILQTITTDYAISYAATTTITFVMAPVVDGYTDVLVINYNI